MKKTAKEHRFCVVGTDMSIYQNQLWDEDITVFHKKVTLTSGKKVLTWERHFYSNCFWKLQNRQTIGGTTIVQNPIYIVRIPLKQESDIIVEIGDIVVKGVIEPEYDPKTEKEIPVTETELKQKYQQDCFMVNSLTDNTKMIHTAHWLLSDTK